MEKTISGLESLSQTEIKAELVSELQTMSMKLDELDSALNKDQAELDPQSSDSFVMEEAKAVLVHKRNAIREAKTSLQESITVLQQAEFIPKQPDQPSFPEKLTKALESSAKLLTKAVKADGNSVAQITQAQNLLRYLKTDN